MTIATNPTRPRLRNDAVTMLHANARTLAMRIATRPPQEQATLLASLFEALADAGVRLATVECAMQGMEVAPKSTPDACHLGRLTQRTDVALCAAKQANTPGAINWGDLRCVEACVSLDSSGDLYYQVSIEEAAPDSTELRQFVADALAAEGWGNVRVVTEW